MLLQLLAILVVTCIGLIHIGLEYKWHDKRTKRHKQIRFILISLMIISFLAASVLVFLDDRQSKKQIQELSKLNISHEKTAEVAAKRENEAIEDRERIKNELYILQEEIKPVVQLATKKYPDLDTKNALFKLAEEIQNLQKQNEELIQGKNELIKSNNQLIKSIDNYQKENIKLKNQVESLKKRTENIDSISNGVTRIGDLVYSKKGTTIKVNSVGNIVLEQINKAKQAYREGDVDKAILIFKETEKSYPKDFPEGAKILKAKYLCKKENFNYALNVLKEINEKTISAENAQYYFYLLGSCYAKLNDYESAAKYYRFVIEKNTNKRITNIAKNNLRIIENRLRN